MKYALSTLVAIACLCSSTAPRVAPRFDRPSTVGIQKANQSAVASVKSARQKATQIGKDNPTLKIQIGAVSADLDSALASLDVSEAARKQLDAQLTAQTDKANKLAGDYDKAAAKIASQDKVISQVNSHWGLGAFAYGIKVLSRHLFILAAVIIVVMVVLFGLSLAFPVFGAGLRLVGSWIAALFNRLRGK